MATTIGIGHSHHPDPAQAFKEAAIAAKNQANLGANDLTIIFATSGYPMEKETFEGLQKILRPEEILYVMTPGIILPGSIEMRGVGILIISSDEIRMNTASIDQLSLLPLQEAGIRVAREAISNREMPKRHAICYFLSGPKKNNSIFIRGLQEGLGRAFPILGAVSHDGTRAGHSMVGLQHRFSDDGAVALLFGGQITLAFASRHGTQPLGRPRIITKVEGNVIREIDGQPANKLYENYFKEELAHAENGQLGEIGLLYPLGVGTKVPKEYQVCLPVEVLPHGGLVVQSEIPSGAWVHLMIGDKDSCRKSAHDAAIEIREKLHGKPPKLILVLESLARHRILGRSSWQEIVMIKEILGLTTPIFGMYTYGEIVPHASMGNIPDIWAQSSSITILAIG
ncbi:MAG: FIST C-terminal domain-containing protein [Candidatus Omnitrophica bacterium]|nr:FIST C-terminal domain-containing protein [Candidatus Omnitrophota bacterium]